MHIDLSVPTAVYLRQCTQRISVQLTGSNVLHPDYIDWRHPELILDLFQNVNDLYSMPVDAMDFIAETPDPSLTKSLDKVRCVMLHVRFHGNAPTSPLYIRSYVQTILMDAIVRMPVGLHQYVGYTDGGIPT